MDIIESDGIRGRKRRTYSAEFKARVIEAAQQPGVSSAAVALAHGLNANMLRTWVWKSAQSTKKSPVKAIRPAFVPVTLPATPTSSEISIDIQHGATKVQVRWPTEAAADCVAMLRDLFQ